jgi:O-antigen ligase
VNASPYLTRREPQYGPLIVIGALVVALVVIGGLAAGLFLPAILGIGAIAVALAVALRPDSATLVAIVLLYTNAAVVATRFYDMPGFVTLIVPLLLCVSLGFHLFVRRQPPIMTAAMPWLAVLLLAQILSTAFASDIGLAADGLVNFIVEGFVLYVLFTNVIRTPAAITQAVWALLIAGALIGGLSGWQQLTGTFNNDYGGFAQVSDAVLAQSEGGSLLDTAQPRLAGSLGEKNHYAQYWLMLVPLGLMVAWGERRRFQRIAAMLLTLLIMLGVVLTFSRGAAVAFAIVLLAMVVLRYIKLWQIAVVGVLAVGLLALFPAYAARLTTLDVADGGATDTVILSRATENVAAALVFLDHPLIGVGPNLFPTFYREYAKEVGVEVHLVDRESHNLLLGQAAETGIIGLIAFLGVLGATAWDLMKARKRWLTVRPDLANIASGFLLSLVAFVAAGLFLHLSYIRYFWLVAALAGVTGYVLNRARLDENRSDDQPHLSRGRS